jgi:4-amino-4-deoxy-L-arabinose transferase-like glycosyltransferase
MRGRNASTEVTSVGDAPSAAASDTLVETRPHQGEPPGAADDSAPAVLAPSRAALTSRQTWWLIGIVGVAAILRIAWLAYANVAPPVSVNQSGDSFSYWYYGNEIANGNGYINFANGEATAYYPIGFPAILGAIYWLANHVPLVDLDLMLVTGAYHVVIATGIVALTFVTGRRVAGPRAGLIAAAVMAVFPNMIYQVTTIQVESTFIFFTLAALAVIVDHDWSSGPPSRNRLLVFGAVLAISALVRPFATPLLLGVFLAILATGVGWRRAALGTAVPLAVIVTAFIPWTVRNHIAMDAFVPSSTNMGDTLCLDRNSEAQGGFRWSTHDGCADPLLPEAERNRKSTVKAVDFVISNPGREALQIGRRAREMFRTDHDGIIGSESLGSGPIFSDTSRNAFSTVADRYFHAVLALAVAGLLLARRWPRPERSLVLTTMLAVLAIPLLLWGTPRFHQPLVPFMAILAATLTVAVVDRFSARGTGAADTA